MFQQDPQRLEQDCRSQTFRSKARTGLPKSKFPVEGQELQDPQRQNVCSRTNNRIAKVKLSDPRLEQDCQNQSFRSRARNFNRIPKVKMFVRGVMSTSAERGQRGTSRRSRQVRGVALSPGDPNSRTVSGPGASGILGLRTGVFPEEAIRQTLMHARVYIEIYAYVCIAHCFTYPPVK